VSSPLKVVLDTNVVLDWLVFCDPTVDAIRTAVTYGDAIPLRSAETFSELQRVLAYPQLRLAPARQTRVVDEFLAMTSAVRLPMDTSLTSCTFPAGFPRCRDRDDQVFFALCLYAGADALVSRDKQVLKLARRARAFHVNVLSIAEVTRRMASLRPSSVAS
jgi:putative PIN family toxin of toxin-antitoxin system